VAQENALLCSARVCTIGCWSSLCRLCAQIQCVYSSSTALATPFMPCRLARRQAELGVGDCGGLRFIPGLTENGKQKTPQWLADLLGVEVPESAPPGQTLKGLIFSDPSNATP
jgi:hypothetical protein